jgi:hypothetical protein
MRDDLLHAQASVDWAVAQLPIFKECLDTWLKDNVDAVVEKTPDDPVNDLVVSVVKRPLPLKFQVEAGAYINVIRSSLDILAVTLANRHCKHLADNAYFPAAKSETRFAGGQYKGSEFVKSLPKRERLIIEDLKPYSGGNRLIYSLHYLDIVRKHARLLSVTVRPDSITTNAKMNEFRAIPAGWMEGGNQKTPICFVAKTVKHPKFHLTPEICLSETKYFKRWEIIASISEFARLATGVIDSFDFS